MGGEVPGQCLRQLWDLRTHPAFGQVGEHRRVCCGLLIDQGLQHQPPGDTHDVGGHRRQFDARVFQQLLQPLDLPGPFLGDVRARPGQIPQLPDL